MREPNDPFGKDPPEEFKDFCSLIGPALVIWQDEEEAHFKLFFKMIGAPKVIKLEHPASPIQTS